VNVGDHVTVPVVTVPETVFPVPVTDQKYPVAFIAEVVNAVLGVPWQMVLAEGVGVVGLPTTGETTTVPLAQVVVLQVPEALT
jgi:hypothetical protein